MKASCLQENLNRALTIVSRSVGGIIPETKNVQLTAKEDKLKLITTDYELTSICRIPASIQEEGHVAVSAKTLKEFVDKLPTDVVKLGWEKQLSVQCGPHKLRIGGTENFVPIPKVEGVSVGVVDFNLLKEALNKVVFAASVSGNRPALSGIYMKFGNGLTLIGADGFMLAINELPVNSEEINIIVPASPLSDLIKLSGQDAKITIGKTAVVFSVDDTDLIIQVMNVEYPPYSQLISEGYSTKLELPRADFLRAVRTISTVNSNTLKLTISDTISMFAGSDIGESECEVEGVITGDKLQVKLNLKYLIDVFGALDKDRAIMEFKGPTGSCRIRPSLGNYFYLMMPMV